jgi:D-arabinose 1-dehydrogenase-like Zn-dependent alcohol dehydrogenase
MAGEGLTVNMSNVVFRGITIQGFWLYKYLIETSRKSIVEDYRELITLCQEGTIRLPDIQTYRLEEYEKAYEEVGKGKAIFFDNAK